MEIKGITVTLYEKFVIGKDKFDTDIYEEHAVNVENVLVAPVTSDDITTERSIMSDKVIYKLAIPKGDTHTWTDCLVEFLERNSKLLVNLSKG